MEKRWIVYEVIGKEEYGAEVIPLHDTHNHIRNSNCVCEPKIEDRVLTHNSFDAREYEEQGYKVITLKI